MSDKTNTPMDPNAREGSNPGVSSTRPRACWAVKTLDAEVKHLFPETVTEFTEPDGRGVALSLNIDASMLDGEDWLYMEALVSLLNDDERVAAVGTEPLDKRAFVQMRSNARTQDTRTSFNLNEAYLIMVDTEGDVAVPEPEFITVAEGYPVWTEDDLMTGTLLASDSGSF